eukprot:766639-Hanusia_phi.AAC.8
MTSKEAEKEKRGGREQTHFLPYRLDKALGVSASLFNSVAEDTRSRASLGTPKRCRLEEGGGGRGAAGSILRVLVYKTVNMKVARACPAPEVGGIVEGQEGAWGGCRRHMHESSLWTGSDRNLPPLALYLDRDLAGRAEIRPPYSRADVVPVRHRGGERRSRGEDGSGGGGGGGGQREIDQNNRRIRKSQLTVSVALWPSCGRRGNICRTSLDFPGNLNLRIPLFSRKSKERMPLPVMLLDVIP